VVLVVPAQGSTPERHFWMRALERLDVRADAEL